jgi:hypothetical protein
MTEAGKVAIVVALIGFAGVVIGKLLDKSGAASTAPGAAAKAGVGPLPSIAGAWTDKDGDALVIVAQGQGRFTVPRWSFDGFVSAAGSVAGPTVSYRYRTKTAAGSCEGAFSADGKTITLACEEPGLSYAQTLTRAGG